MKIPLQGCFNLQKNSQYRGYSFITSTQLRRHNPQECSDFLNENQKSSIFLYARETRILGDVKKNNNTKTKGHLPEVPSEVCLSKTTFLNYLVTQ